MPIEENRPENTKQWFVWIDDRYRGPYSERQIRSTIEQGALMGANLIWKEGMLDWEILAKVAEFNLPESQKTADAQISAAALSFLDYMEPEEEDVEPTVAPAEDMPATPKFQTQPAAPAFNPEFWLPEAERKKPVWKNKVAVGGALLTAALTVALSLWQFTRAGFPVLKELNARDGQELRAVALEDASYAGFTAGSAMVPGNFNEPRFYIASNAKDGEELEVQLLGLRDTMVGSFYYSAGTRVKIKNHFAKTPAFHQDAGKPLSAGEYALTVYKDGVQLSQKTFFLGGLKDAGYAANLKIYQDRLRAQGDSELSEIRQVTDLLEKQFNESNLRFKTGKGWAKFHEQWTALQNQIEILFKEVNGEILNREFYHGPLYGLLSEATSLVSQLHAAQNESMLLGQSSPQKIADGSRAAHSRLLTLRAKLLQAERLSGI